MWFPNDSWAIFLNPTEEEKARGIVESADNSQGTFPDEMTANITADNYRVRMFDPEDFPLVTVSQVCNRHDDEDGNTQFRDAALCPCNEDGPYSDDRGELSGHGKHV